MSLHDNIACLAAYLQPQQSDEALFAVLDGCKAGGMPFALLEQGYLSYPLCWCQTSVELQKELPWLVAIPPEQKVLADILEQFGEGWGIFFHSKKEFWDIFAHLSSLPICDLPSGGTTWFRYYTPCFFRSFIANTDETNLLRMFGDVIDAFFVEAHELGIFQKFLPCQTEIKSITSSNRMKLHADLLEHLEQTRTDETLRAMCLYYIEKTGNSILPGTIEHAALETKLDDLMTQAAAYKIHEIAALMTYLDAAIMWGWDFDKTNHEARKALTTEGAPGWMRVEFLKTLLDNGEVDYA